MTSNIRFKNLCSIHLKRTFFSHFQVKQNLIQHCLFLPFCLNAHLLGSWEKGWFSNSCPEAINGFDLEKNWKPVGCTTSSNLLQKIYLLMLLCHQMPAEAY